MRDHIKSLGKLNDAHRKRRKAERKNNDLLKEVKLLKEANGNL